MSPELPLSGGAVKARPRRSSWLLRLTFGALLLGLGAALAVVAALMGLTALTLFDSPSAMAGSPGTGLPIEDQRALEANVWDRHGPVNVLLIGVDRGLSEGCRESSYTLSDTILLVRFDPVTKRAGIMSIPRDLFVFVSGYGGRKITSAHAIGENHKKKQGPDVLAQTIRDNLELPVHRFIRVDINGFEKIVDAIGGVDIDVPPSRWDSSIGLYDPDYPDGNCGTIELTFLPGPQHLDGAKALQYARSRHTTSDFDRSRRQMDILMAVRKKALGLGLVRNLPGLLPAALDTVTTDFTAREILSLARSAVDVPDDAIYRYPLDHNVVYDDWVVVDNVPQAVLRLNPSTFESLRNSFLGLAPPPAPTPTPGASQPAAP